jgi:hypothetical protein
MQASAGEQQPALLITHTRRVYWQTYLAGDKQDCPAHELPMHNACTVHKLEPHNACMQARLVKTRLGAKPFS